MIKGTLWFRGTKMIQLSSLFDGFGFDWPRKSLKHLQPESPFGHNVGFFTLRVFTEAFK